METSGDDIVCAGKCVVCDKLTTLRCQACLKGYLGSPIDIPYYCGREHQVVHWKNGHKALCAKHTVTTAESAPTQGPGWKMVSGPYNFEGEQSNVLPNIPHFIATQDLPAGHILFKRKPLLAIPNHPSKREYQLYRAGVPSAVTDLSLILPCISCYEMLNYGEANQSEWLGGMVVNKCLNCNWPLHSYVHPQQGPSFCQISHASECQVLRKNGLTWDVVINMYPLPVQWYSIGLLRAVLLPSDLKKEFMNLPVLGIGLSSLSPQMESSIDFVRNKCKLGSQVSEEDMRKILNIIFGNIWGPINQTSSKKTKLAFVAFQGGPTGRVLTHDCTPNCVPLVDRYMVATFKTIRPVKKGQLLTINYLMSNMSSICKPITDKVSTLVQMLIPPCACKRCRSPDEGGTMFSVIKCPADKSKKKECEYLVPYPNRVDSNVSLSDMFVWKCACRSCPAATKQKAVEHLVSTLKEQIENAATSSNPYKDLKSIIAKFSGKIVHPGHAMMLYAQLNVVGFAMRQINKLNQYKDPNFTFDLHKKYLGDFDAALKRVEEVQPGRIEEAGAFILAQSWLRMSQLAEKVQDMQTKPSFEDLDKELVSIIESLKEGMIILTEHNPLLEQFDTAREEKLTSVYANQLYSMIVKSMGSSVEEKVAAVKVLKRKYVRVPLNLDMSPEEEEYRKMLVIPSSQVPKLIEALKKDFA